MTVLVPELTDQLEWVNRKRPVTLAGLRGKVVLLYFWSAGSVNARHSLADLRYLENNFEDELAVIGLHSPKFTREKSLQHVRDAVSRLDLRHPVANDPEFLVWQEYGVTRWPTFALIDVEGNLRYMVSGEGRRQELDGYISELVEEAVLHDVLNYEPIELKPSDRPNGVLAFPGAVMVHDERLYIVDSGNHRVLECGADGGVMRQFGSGNPGFWDGVTRDAGFHSPAGICYYRDSLYVADCGNHAIRKIGLLSGEVETLIGNGSQGCEREGEFSSLKSVKLNSPVDLAEHKGMLYLSMAGQHQVWRVDLGQTSARVEAGQGLSGIRDGAGLQSRFSEPRGLAAGEDGLYVVDAANSALRRMQYRGAAVSTLVGKGGFFHGDRDGQRSKAQLQYPTGISIDRRSGLVWLADTYNNKIRCYDPGSAQVTTPLVDYEFNEPRDVAIGGSVMWVANTNAHEIVLVNLENGAGEALEITNIPDSAQFI